MMNSTITQNKTKRIIFKTLRAVSATALWVLVWDVAAVLVARNNSVLNIFLPRPAAVVDKWLEIAFTKVFLSALLTSFSRILSGFAISFTIGAVMGVLTSSAKVFDWLFSPVFKVIRAIPVAAVTILFFAFFESEALPTAVVVLMVAPLIWQTVHDGLSTPQKNLNEMARVYSLGTVKTVLYIKLPCLFPSLVSNTVNALGLAWKSGVAAEVIIGTSIVGLGAELKHYQGIVGYDEVYAITLTVVILSLIIEVLLKFLCRKFLERGSMSVD